MLVLSDYLNTHSVSQLMRNFTKVQSIKHSTKITCIPTCPPPWKIEICFCKTLRFMLGNEGSWFLANYCYLVEYMCGDGGVFSFLIKTMNPNDIFLVPLSIYFFIKVIKSNPSPLLPEVLLTLLYVLVYGKSWHLDLAQRVVALTRK